MNNKDFDEEKFLKEEYAEFFKEHKKHRKKQHYLLLMKY